MVTFPFQDMMSQFRVQELRKVLGSAGYSPSGNKAELQHRAKKLLHSHPTLVQPEIKKLHKSLQ